MATVRQIAPEVLRSVPPKSLPTYGKGLRLLVAELGDLDVAAVRLPHLEALRDTIRRTAGQQVVEKALRTGRPLRAYDPDAHGQGAAENYVRAARLFFRYAVSSGHLAASPALELRAPARLPAPERALTSEELGEIWTVATTTGRDPRLDGLLLTFLRHTAARREGVLNLAIDHLDLRRPSVTLTEKNGRTRELPLRSDLVESLASFARARAASKPGDRVFRALSGRPITRRHFNTLFDRIDRHVGWTRPLDVGAHWIRHTTLTDVAMVAGARVAAAYAGHADAAVGVIGLYTKVTFEDLLAAYEAVFGEVGSD